MWERPPLTRPRISDSMWRISSALCDACHVYPRPDRCDLLREAPCKSKKGCEGMLHQRSNGLISRLSHPFQSLQFKQSPRARAVLIRTATGRSTVPSCTTCEMVIFRVFVCARCPQRVAHLRALGACACFRRRQHQLRRSRVCAITRKATRQRGWHMSLAMMLVHSDHRACTAPDMFPSHRMRTMCECLRVRPRLCGKCPPAGRSSCCPSVQPLGWRPCPRPDSVSHGLEEFNFRRGLTMFPCLARCQIRGSLEKGCRGANYFQRNGWRPSWAQQ